VEGAEGEGSGALATRGATIQVLRSLLLVAWALAVCGRPVATPAADTAETIAAWVEEARAAAQSPGAVVVVLRGDGVVVARGFGVESLERADPVSPATIFPLNSISKQLTAALVVRLAEEGKLSLDDPVRKHLPDFEKLPPTLTVRHLLTHTSGLRESFVQPEIESVIARLDATDAELAARMREAPFDHPPGERWTYVNLNYFLAGQIAERAAGTSLETALRARFFGPLELTSMRMCPQHPGDVAGSARGHHRGEAGALVAHPPENFALFRGWGGFCGSALDLARWTRALANGRLVSAESYRAMIAPARLLDGSTADYGMAVVLVEPDGFERRAHGGYGGGFSAQAAYYPAQDATVVVMFNRWVFPEHVERRIARRLHGLAEARLKPVTTSLATRARYVGRYDLGVVGWYPQFVERDGKLWFEVAPLQPQPLVYVGGDTFVHEGEPYGHRFAFGPDQPQRKVRMLAMGLMTWYGERLQP
jgi:CubicO group peptidase (beta-lactamase class C family)